MANLVIDREGDLELWIRPERAGYGYTIEWTTLVEGPEDQEWRPRETGTSGDTEDHRSLWDVLRRLLTRINDCVI